MMSTKFQSKTFGQPEKSYQTGKTYPYNTIPEALEDLRAGKIILKIP